VDPPGITTVARSNSAALPGRFAAYRWRACSSRCDVVLLIDVALSGA
jgi:hypothetical protein